MRLIRRKIEKRRKIRHRSKKWLHFFNFYLTRWLNILAICPYKFINDFVFLCQLASISTMLNWIELIRSSVIAGSKCWCHGCHSEWRRSSVGRGRRGQDKRNERQVQPMHLHSTTWAITKLAIILPIASRWLVVTITCCIGPCGEESCPRCPLPRRCNLHRRSARLVIRSRLELVIRFFLVLLSGRRRNRLVDLLNSFLTIFERLRQSRNWLSLSTC